MMSESHFSCSHHSTVSTPQSGYLSYPPTFSQKSLDMDQDDTVSSQSSMAAEYYLTNTKRRGLLGHVSFGVRSYDVSKKFYNAILAPFGVKLVYDDSVRKIMGYGFDVDHEMINIFERGEAARSPGLGTHLAFNAPSRKVVREFWHAGTKNGGSNEGEPGLRENYGKNYFAAFLFDPDGFKLEAVYQEAV